MGQDQKFTPRQWVTLFVISSVHFFSAICISLQAPFYPGEAEKKGATATEYGLVFGVFELVSFLSSPLYGKYYWLGNLNIDEVTKTKTGGQAEVLS